jgi:phosphate transport system ATP-binding protein
MDNSMSIFKQLKVAKEKATEYANLSNQYQEEELSPIIKVENLSFYYGKFKAIKNLSFSVLKNKITAIIGPSGCGKSTLIRCFNRMNDLNINAHIEGRIFFEGIDIFDKSVDVVELRKRIGMVFQRPNPFPKSIYDNVAFGPQLYGVHKLSNLDEIVERSLRQAALWDEVKDKLKQSAFSFSGGQQQRLCIARALAIEPDVILMDEPCSALDPIATLKIEDLMRVLSKQYTIIIVTHNMQQAARASDYTMFLTMEDDRSGILVEFGSTARIFTLPRDKRTEGYITGRFG